MNVRINLSSLADDRIAAEIGLRLEEFQKQASVHLEAIEAAVTHRGKLDGINL
jgi:hypothetical protein